MPDTPLQVDSKSLTKTVVSMSKVAEQLAQLESLIDQHCYLPSLALGGIGYFACARYNGGCTDASTKMGGLHTEADTIAEMLGKNAIGYISAEVANLQAIEQAATKTKDSAVGPSGGRVADVTATGVLSASLFGMFALRKAQAGKLAEAEGSARSMSAELDMALQQATKVWKAEMDLEFERYRMHPAEAVLAETEFNEYSASNLDKTVLGTLERRIATVDRVSQLASLSQRTESILRMTGSFNITAIAASMLWTANAVVMSDDLIDTAIGSWYEVAAGARTIFSEWMPAIRASLFPDWIGAASTAAERRFAAFIADGMAFADQAKRTAFSLTAVVRCLNGMYWSVFTFTTMQFVEMIALSVTALIDPTAVIQLQYLGCLLQASVTVSVNAILAVLGALLAWTAA